MARRRMFSLDIVDTDKFACLSKDARYLYYELGVRADDDGFIGSPIRIIRMIECTTNDLEELIENGFVIKFETGVIAISDWKIHNTVRKDMYKKTIYQKELKQLSEVEKRYCLIKKRERNNDVTSDVTENVTSNAICNNNVTENVTSNAICNNNVTENEEITIYNDTENVTYNDTENVTHNVSLGKVRLGKDRLGKIRLGKDSNLNDPQEIADLFNELCNSFEPVTNILNYSNELSSSLMKGFTKHDYITAFSKAEDSNYLKGLTSKRKKPADFPWILKHLEEIKQGKYDDFKK